jgi:hypothetical protein
VHVSFIALAFPTYAWAQCSPDPTQAGTAVTCTGSDSNGIVITTSVSPLTVASGASVTNTGAPAIAVSIPATSAFNPRSASITVNGSVAGSGAAGISVQSGSLGSASYDYYGTTAAITLGASGSVSGTYGIAVAQTPGNTYGAAYVKLDNAGKISGTSGIALYSSGTSAAFSSIINRASGTIGAIQANAVIDNAGTIDGGSLSAIAPGAGSTIYYGGITNSGIITAAGSNSTIANYAAQISNSGTIKNTGSGGAIDGSSLSIVNLAGGTITASNSSVLGLNASSLSLTNAGTISNTGNGAVIDLRGSSLSVTNQAGGVIATSAGNTVISTSTALNLVNQGTITGNVIASWGSATYTANSTVDSTGGTINGNLTLGYGSDTLVATLRNGSLYTGITGTIDGGAGVNTVLLKTTADATLSAALTLPTNFSVLDLAPAAGTTLTLAQGYNPGSTINFDGAGTLDNQATINSSGQILTQLSGSSGGGTFLNEGAISSTFAGSGAAVSMVTGSINNTGSISATNNAVTLSAGNNFANSGSITAGGTAASVYVGSSFSNSGTIRSTGGTGLSLMYSCTCGTGTNSGTISGAGVGLRFSGGTLVNTGTIASAGGTAAVLNSYSTIDNRAGGVISGGTNAITTSGGSTFNISVYNAGTINGNVNLASNSSFASFSGNTYVASAGGVLNGNLTLGSGDRLVTTLSGSGTSGYAGINGTVSASNSILRYDVTANASDTLSTHAGFSTLGYQVAGGATLTLGTSGTWGSTVNLAGTGNVVLNGSVSTTNQAALTSTSVIQSGLTVPATALTITNNGTLAMTRSSSSALTGTVQLPSGYSGTTPVGSTFINNGTVSITDTTGMVSTNAAVNGSTVINNGLITGNGATAVMATVLTNTGTITSNGNTVLTSGSTLTNSGTITSTTGSAVTSVNYVGSGDALINQAGGTINGSGNAVQLIGGLVSNAGTINGNVNLGYATYGVNSVSGIYVANGGTLNGNLTFGNGSNYLVETGTPLGVTGTITTGSGINWLGHQRSGTATVTLGSTLPTGFSQEFTVAAGATSQVTINGPSGTTSNIFVGGDGTIVNRLATTGFVSGLNAGTVNYTPYLNTDLANFINQANIGSANLRTTGFTNTATIGSASLSNAAVTLSTTRGFTFSNSGTILNSAGAAALSLTGTTTASSTIANSGTITGGMTAAITAAAGTSVSITNSGTITGSTVPTYVYDPTVSPFYQIVNLTTAVNASASGAQSLSLANSGTITGDIALTGTDVTLVNTGTITGNITTGSGNDNIAMNGVFAGSVNGGAGTNTLSINGGTQAAPVAFTSVSNIATLAQTGGFATVSGTGTFGNATLTGGRLVGLAGSVLTAASFNVGANATFGSAGTVNGNVIVSGTLSPGASPGTMTVNGNVTLNSGSTSLFEITPTVSDKLIVNGKMTILSGSTLQIASTTPIKVGTTLDLISATGGVSGTYDTVSGIAGTARVLANGDLGLLVQFATPASYTPQVRNAIAYVNSAMAASSAPTALFPALSALQDGNAAPIASAFARLTPEPYADAMQIGTETALSLAGNARQIGEGEVGGPTHLFSFGQALGSMRQFASNEEQGVSHATVNGYGALGGLGVAGEDYAVSAYVGWVGQDQSIGMLGASTRARGVVGGVAAVLAA